MTQILNRGAAAFFIVVLLYQLCSQQALSLALAILVIHGKPDHVHTYVVGIMKDNTIFCTGTVIAKRTILTAAHCVKGYESEIASHFTYSNEFELKACKDPECKSNQKKLVDGTFPGKDSKGPAYGCSFCYDDTTYLHDIGLLYLAEDADAAAIRPLPIDLNAFPRMSAIIGVEPLTFSGYGLANSNDTSTIGQRLMQDWPADRADDWTLYYKTNTKINPSDTNTCRGDSGGPALYNDIVLAITSNGDKTCTIGASTRVDSHLKWILSHLSAA